MYDTGAVTCSQLKVSRHRINCTYDIFRDVFECMFNTHGPAVFSCTETTIIVIIICVCICIVIIVITVAISLVYVKTHARFTILNILITADELCISVLCLLTGSSKFTVTVTLW